MKHSKLFLSLCLMFVIVGCVATFTACITDTEIEHLCTWEEIRAEKYACEEAPACKGVFYKSCDCGKINKELTFVDEPLQGHVFDEELVLENDANLASAADCNSKPTYYKVCSLCHEAIGTDTFELESGSVLGHNKKSYAVLDESDAEECTIGHSMAKMCTRCGEVDSVYLYNYRRGKDWKLVKKPSCSFNAKNGKLSWTTGVLEGKCLDCGKKLTITMSNDLPDPYSGEQTVKAVAETADNGIEEYGYYTIADCKYSGNCSVADVVTYAYKVYGHLDGETCSGANCSCTVSFTVDILGLHALTRNNGTIAYIDIEQTYYSDDYPELQITGNEILSCANPTGNLNAWFDCARCKKTMLVNVKERHLKSTVSSDITVITKADCENDGAVTYKCTRCNLNVFNETVKATGHNYSYKLVYDGGWNVVANCSNANCPRSSFTDKNVSVQILSTVNSTCKDKGVQKVRTTKKYDGKYINGERELPLATTHRFTDGGNNMVLDITKVYDVSSFKNGVYPELTGNNEAPVCGTKGKSAFFVCADCNKPIIINIRYEHTKGTKLASQAATCTEGGYDTWSCPVCQETFKDYTSNALGHNYQASITSYPTYDTTGEYTIICSRCNATKIGTLPTLDSTQYTLSVTDPTCELAGNKAYSIKVKDGDGKQHTLVINVTVDPLGHTHTKADYKDSADYREWDITDPNNDNIVYHCVGFYCSRCEKLVIVEKKAK